MVNDNPVLTLDQVAVILRARSVAEARRWLLSEAPETILLWNPPRVSKELLLLAIARGRALGPGFAVPPEVIS